MPSSRDAVFVVSPIAVYSRRRSEPTLPGHDLPLFRPMPIPKPSLVPLLAEPGVEARQALREHLPRGGDGAVGVVGLLERRAEDGHDPVAHVGDERAAVVEDRLGHLAEVVVEDSITSSARSASEKVVKPRRSVNMTVPRGATPPRRRSVVGLREHLVDDLLRHEAREDVAHPLALERLEQVVRPRARRRPRGRAPRADRRTTTIQPLVERRAGRRPAKSAAATTRDERAPRNGASRSPRAARAAPSSDDQERR